MQPAVAEIVFIRERLPLAQQHLAEKHGVLVAHVASALHRHLLRGIELLLEAAAKTELVHVIADPSHHRHEQGMEFAQLPIVRHQHPAPDRRLNVAECDPKLEIFVAGGVQTPRGVLVFSMAGD
jgi:hypothetical protein